MLSRCAAPPPGVRGQALHTAHMATPSDRHRTAGRIATLASGAVIDGVKVVPLRQIVDERGKIMHMLKATDPHFIAVGEIYFSTAWPGTVKAWHIHQTMAGNNAVISGRAKLVLYDSREDSPTKGEPEEIFLGEDNYVLAQIPPGIANG